MGSCTPGLHPWFDEAVRELRFNRVWAQEVLLFLCRTSGTAWLLKLSYSCFSTSGFLK